MPIDVRKRRAEDEMREFWQVEIAENSPTIMDGTVGKLHDNVEFPLSIADAKAMLPGLAYFLAEMGVIRAEVACDIADVIAFA